MLPCSRRFGPNLYAGLKHRVVHSVAHVLYEDDCKNLALSCRIALQNRLSDNRHLQSCDSVAFRRSAAYSQCRLCASYVITIVLFASLAVLPVARIQLALFSCTLHRPHLGAAGSSNLRSHHTEKVERVGNFYGCPAMYYYGAETLPGVETATAGAGAAADPRAAARLSNSRSRASAKGCSSCIHSSCIRRTCR